MVTHPSTFYLVIVMNTHSSLIRGASEPSWTFWMWSIYTESRLHVTGSKGVPQLPETFTWQRKETLCGLIINFIYILYIFIDFSSLARSLSCFSALTHLSHLLSFIFVYNVTKMVTGLKLQSPKTNSENRGGGEKGEEGGLLLFAAHHWQLQQRGHSLLDARTSKRRRRRLLPRRAALSELEVLQRHI